MTHWLEASVEEQLLKSIEHANFSQLYFELKDKPAPVDYDLLERSAEAYELITLDYLSQIVFEDNETLAKCRVSAEKAFKLFSVLPSKRELISEFELRLRQSALAVIADKSSDASRILKESSLPQPNYESLSWKERTWLTILETWLLLIRKDGWDDRDLVLEKIQNLRAEQKCFEEQYLATVPDIESKQAALELVVLYHLAKVVEVLAMYMTDGVIEGNFQAHQILESHFDRIDSICNQTSLVLLEPIIKLLSASSHQMIENSIWTVTRAVNSRVTKFVREIVGRGRGNKALFDMLPPQRRALAEKGLLGSSRRAVVVSLPTSSGKTLIAQFRILQALNQFDEEDGWVVYLAPTRTLVNQVTRKLRRDFSPLGVIVEQVSPALEIDGVEASILKEENKDKQFRVLVTTPEKLDLMLRQGWEKSIGRPLTLVVVDEAHNIQGENRGLKLELLLSTINNECENAQFLLLTPFIPNAREIAKWLGGVNSDDISLALDWQPNDRAIGIASVTKGKRISSNSYEYNLNFKTVHTTRNTIHVNENLELHQNPKKINTYAKANNKGEIAAITAKALVRRGPVIVMHSRPDWVWSLAEKLKGESEKKKTSESIKLVHKFLEKEFGKSFPLLELLEYRIGVHHAGLSEEARVLMEWLFEKEELDYLVATTTIAQGVNFPITGVVMASAQYPSDKGTVDMPPEDFWNIAGRAGRVDQGKLGVVALAARGDEASLEKFITKQTEDLNSALIAMVKEAGDKIDDLEKIVYTNPEWSSFVQYLTHTYSQMGKPKDFVDQVELVLRGTLGFKKLRASDSIGANRLIAGIRSYINYIQKPGQPLSLVDSTGFSLQSIKTVLVASKEDNVKEDDWRSKDLFSSESSQLQNMMGVILRVPELRDNLEAVTGNQNPDGNKLSLIIKDWVNGEDFSDIANNHFNGDVTTCGQNLFGKLSLTASWGLGALLSITGSGLSEEEFEEARNLPSNVFYGVKTKDEIMLRLLGIPRTAAPKLSKSIKNLSNQSLSTLRDGLVNMSEAEWCNALGGEDGKVYRKVWRILEGIQ